MKKYNCPVCNTSLSKSAYEKVLGSVEEKERVLEAERAKMTKENNGLRRQLAESRKAAAAAREEGMRAERARNGRVLVGKDRRIHELEEALRRVKTGATAQTAVLVVGPLAVVHVCSLLRDSLIGMARSKFDRQTRAAIAQRLMAYVTGPEFTNYVERMVRFSADMQESLEAEIREHTRGWERRRDCYEALGRETAHTQRNLSLVLHGKEPRLLEAPKVTRLPVRKRITAGA